jgi:hypothetical protein
VPDEIDVQRARQILEAIRKRLGNALSPELERSYLERLLEMKLEPARRRRLAPSLEPRRSLRPSKRCLSPAAIVKS